MPSKRSLFISNLKHPNVDVYEGQKWVRKRDVDHKLYPFVLTIVEKLDRLGRRFRATTIRDEELFFDREDLIENYDLRKFDRELTIDQQISEIKGYRFEEDHRGELVVRNPGSRGGAAQPVTTLTQYTKKIKNAEGLFQELYEYHPKVDVMMGAYKISLLNKKGDLVTVKEKTRVLAICAVYIKVFG